MYSYPCPAHDVIIERISPKIAITQISLHRVRDFTRFVFSIYKERFAGEARWVGSASDLMKMMRSELRYAPQGIYLVAEDDEQRIIGGVRGLRYEPGTVFTTEAVFGLSPHEIAQRYSAQLGQIWHGNQLVISRDRLRGLSSAISSRSIVKRLLLHMLRAVIQCRGALMVAETDEVAERMYATYGLAWEPQTDYRRNIGWDRASVLTVDSVLRSEKFRKVLAQESLAIPI